jgi:hypothetical protein
MGRRAAPAPSARAPPPHLAVAAAVRGRGPPLVQRGARPRRRLLQQDGVPRQLEPARAALPGLPGRLRAAAAAAVDADEHAHVGAARVAVGEREAPAARRHRGRFSNAPRAAPLAARAAPAL